MNNSSLDFIEVDNSEDFRRTAGGSFSSDPDLGEPYGKTGADVFRFNTGIPSPYPSPGPETDSSFSLALPTA